MRTNYIQTFFLCLVCQVLALASGCGGGNGGLSGTWETQKHYRYGGFEEYASTIQFSGKAFTITVYTLHSPYDSVPGGSEFRDGGLRFINTPTSDSTSLKTVNFGGGAVGGGGWTATLYRTIVKGTYSITDDKQKIELKFVDGDISVCRFDRTENTITIDGEYFTRK